MRIVGGRHRGRGLESPDGQGTRPTSDRARQAVFNILDHAGWRTRDLLQGAMVMDVFAGTGALGLEALSRGAAHAVFVEQDKAALAACRANITKMGEGENGTVMVVDALKIPARPAAVPARCLLFLDPPYGRGLGAQALLALADKGWLAEGAVAVMEMAKKEPESPPPGWEVMDERVYGVALVRFLRRG